MKGSDRVMGLRASAAERWHHEGMQPGRSGPRGSDRVSGSLGASSGCGESLGLLSATTPWIVDRGPVTGSP